MLIHLSPTCISPWRDVELVDIEIPQLDMLLTSGKEVVARRPHPNKHHVVACRNTGKKAVAGLLINCDRAVRDFTVQTRWAINCEHVAIHRVDYHVLDDEFGLVSDRMILWGSRAATLSHPGWVSRWPKRSAEALAPLHAQPTFWLDARTRLPYDAVALRNLQRRVSDTEPRLMAEQQESFALPTLEPGRLAWLDRAPALEQAFAA